MLMKSLCWIAAKLLRPQDRLVAVEKHPEDGAALAAALKQAGGRLSGPEGAAKLLGMRPTTLASRVKALGLNAKPQDA